MSVETKCDRCGKVIKDDLDWHKALLQEFVRGRFHWLNDARSRTSSYDFCAECLRDFEVWRKEGAEHGND